MVVVCFAVEGSPIASGRGSKTSDEMDGASHRGERRRKNGLTGHFDGCGICEI